MPKYLRIIFAAFLLSVVSFVSVPQIAWCEEQVTAENSLQTLSPGDSIYVDGKNGDDGNEGTEESPVKSFARAKELMNQYGSDIIWVTGTLQVSGSDEAWDLDGKSLMRDSLFRGELVHVSGGATLKLTNIVVDGGCKNGATGVASDGNGSGGSLFGVFGSSGQTSTLTIGEGASLQNNAIRSEGRWMPESGGAVYASNAAVNVEGGSILGNSAVYGGGICAVYDSVVNVTSGLIDGNKAVEGTNKSATRGYSGTGGGICAWRGAAVNFSGGTVSNNTAFNRGGGISMGGLDVFPGDKSSVLVMTAGTLSGNKAGSAGGGLFVQAGLSEEGGSGTPNYCIAKITGGSIVGNAMTDKGDSNSSFGGGGIYVNGYSGEYSVFHNGELYLSNVEISGNSASLAGGAYAGCPVSQTNLFLNNGSVCYGNTTKSGSAREVYILASTAYGAHSGNPEYEITPSMLGGGSYRWTYDDGTEVPLDKLKGSLDASRGEELSLGNALSAGDEDVQHAVKLSQVHITGNESDTRGGGIGSNGSVFIGKYAETCDVQISKQWNDLDNKDGVRPSSVEVELYRNGMYVGFQTVVPDQDGNWNATFKNLPKVDADGNAYTYSVKERSVEGYSSSVEKTAEDNFIITNTRSISVSVSKKWIDNDNASGQRPSSIIIELLADGEVAKTATIEPDANGAWAKTFDGLAKYDKKDGHTIDYKVREIPVDGYDSSVEGNVQTGFSITNAKQLNGSFQLELLKTVNGKAPNRSFDFALEAVGDNKGDAPKFDIDVVSSDETTGRASFGPAKLSDKDRGKIYAYKIVETSELGDGWEAAVPVYAFVSVSRDPDENGNLVASVSYSANENAAESYEGPALFDNKYEQPQQPGSDTPDSDQPSDNASSGVKTGDSLALAGGALAVIALVAAGIAAFALSRRKN